MVPPGRWLALLLVLVVMGSEGAPQGTATTRRMSKTSTTTTPPTPPSTPRSLSYWWLEAEVSPFGGRNYNIEEAGHRDLTTDN